MAPRPPLHIAPSGCWPSGWAALPAHRPNQAPRRRCPVARQGAASARSCSSVALSPGLSPGLEARQAVPVAGAGVVAGCAPASLWLRPGSGRDRAVGRRRANHFPGCGRSHKTGMYLRHTIDLLSDMGQDVPPGSELRRVRDIRLRRSFRSSRLVGSFVPRRPGINVRPSPSKEIPHRNESSLERPTILAPVAVRTYKKRQSCCCNASALCAFRRPSVRSRAQTIE